jgi:hypothetical protein
MSQSLPFDQKNSVCRLTVGQLERYRRDGYLVVPEPIFPQSEFDALKQHFEEMLAQLPPGARPEAMGLPHLADTKLFRWLLSDTLLDLVEPIIGPDIALFATQFICKPRGDGKRVPWHEDSFYWREMIEPVEVVTIWLAIDPSTAENGAMQVIPRALHGYSEYEDVDMSTHVFPIEIKAAMRDESKAVTIELQPNHASLHDAKLMHGSAANTSTLRRCGYTIRYVPIHVKFHPKFKGGFHFYLARGQDRGGNVYGDPTKSYDDMMRSGLNRGRQSH